MTFNTINQKNDINPIATYFKTKRDTFLRLTLACLLLCCFYSSLRIAVHVVQPKPYERDFTARNHLAIIELKPQLPRQGVIGYAGEKGDFGYYRMQYALAPLVLDRENRERKFLVVEFSSPVFVSQMMKKGYHILQTYNSGPLKGVTILRKQ